MKTLTAPAQQSLDWSRSVGQRIGKSVMHGEITPEDGATLLFSNTNYLPAFAMIAALEAAAWMTDSIEADFRTAVNRLALETTNLRPIESA